MRSGNKDRKTHLTTWNDLKPWIEQLFSDHGVHVRFLVSIEAERYGLHPTVTCELYRVLVGPKIEEVRREYRWFDPCVEGAVEAICLQLVSYFLLDLENEKALAERQTALWPG